MNTQAPQPTASPVSAQFHIDEEIACLMRELKLRKTNYPNWVDKGRMKQADADYEINVMQSTLNRLKALRYLMQQIAPVL